MYWYVFCFTFSTMAESREHEMPKTRIGCRGLENTSAKGVRDKMDTLQTRSK